MKKHTLFKCLFSLLSGAIAALPLVIDTIPFLSFLLFLPFVFFLFTLGKEVRLRFYYLSGLCFFFGYYACAFSFFAAMYPLDFAGLGTLESIAVLFAAMVLLPLFQAWFSAFSVLLFGLFKRCGRLRFPLAEALVFSALFTLFAYMQNFTWAGVPWGNTAVGLASSPLLLQSASIFGTSFLVFLTVFCNAALVEGYLFFRDCKDKKALMCLLSAVFLLSSHLLFGAVRLSTAKEGKDTLTVAVLQGNAPATEDTYIDVHLRTCRYEARAAAREGDVDLMLWSESVLTYTLQSDELARDFFASVAIETGAMQVVGAFSSEKTPEGEKGYYNALFLFYPDGSMDEVSYKKRRPVPFGEYVPMPWLFETVIPALTEISMLSRNTTPGNAPEIFQTERGNFGGLICFDSIYPTLARESAKAGAEVFLLSTDDSWFDGSFGKSLHFRHAVLRAVECKKAVVRTGNTGISGVIDAYGRTQTEIPPDEIGHGISTLAKNGDVTLYTIVGDVFPLSLLFFLLLLPLPFEKCRRRKHPFQKG